MKRRGPAIMFVLGWMSLQLYVTPDVRARVRFAIGQYLAGHRLAEAIPYRVSQRQEWEQMAADRRIMDWRYGLGDKIVRMDWVEWRVLVVVESAATVECHVEMADFLVEKGWAPQYATTVIYSTQG